MSPHCICAYECDNFSSGLWLLNYFITIYNCVYDFSSLFLFNTSIMPFIFAYEMDIISNWYMKRILNSVGMAYNVHYKRRTLSSTQNAHITSLNILSSRFMSHINSEEKKRCGFKHSSYNKNIPNKMSHAIGTSSPTNYNWISQLN